LYFFKSLPVFAILFTGHIHCNSPWTVEVTPALFFSKSSHFL